MRFTPRIPGILRPHDFKAVVPVSGSSVVWEGYFYASQPKDHGSMKPNRSSWSYRGKPLPFVPKGLTPESPERARREQAGHMVDFYASGYRDKAAVERARIPVEKIEAPTLLVATETDGAWKAAEMSRDVESRMRARPPMRFIDLSGLSPPDPPRLASFQSKGSGNISRTFERGTVRRHSRRDRSRLGRLVETHPGVLRRESQARSNGPERG